MKLTVRGPRVFIRAEEQPTETESGLQLVYDRQHSTMRGKVVALGDGPVTGKGIKLDHYVSVGDRVIFSPDSGEEVMFEKETVICMNEDQILAVIEG